MYEIDGICYAGNPTSEIRVVDAKPLAGEMILLTFSSGEKRLFDATQLTEPAFKRLKDKRVFDSPTVQHGFVSWDDGSIDLAPEYMYDRSYAYDEECPGVLTG